MAKLNRTQVLADAVAASFESAGHSPADLLQGQIVLTDLPWQAPPLEPKALLRGVALAEYLDYPLPIDTRELYEFYKRGLFLLHHAPQEITDHDGFKGLKLVIPRCSPGERHLTFYRPVGWPAGDETTGPFFAMECARLFKTSSDLGSFKSDDSNYYAETAFGNVGIVDGKVSEMSELWDISCSGYVQGMLEQPRGEVSMACLYDVVARLRSALHQEPERFAEFEAVDYALQALRILSNGQMCREMHTAIQQMSTKAFKRRLRIEAFKQAIEVMKSWHLPDRAKISMLQEILVPAHFRLYDFARKIMDPYRIMPTVLANKTEARIIAVLENEYKKASYNERALVPQKENS